MSYLITQPEALNFAAGKLEGLGSSLAAQNASAAAPTTSMAAPASDEVSTLQAALFTTYGNLYQQVSAQATAIGQQFSQMLGTSADSYGATETANSAATSSSTALSTLSLGSIGGISIPGQLTQFDSFGIIPGAITNGGLIALNEGGSAGAAYMSAASSASSGSSSGGAGSGDAGSGSAGSGDPGSGDAGYGNTPDLAVGGISLAGAASPAGVGEAPVLAGLGQAPAVGGLSVPPSWAAGDAIPAVSSTPTTLVGEGWTSAPAGAAPVSTVPAGMPAMATAGKAAGLGSVPRYGAKPTVMPKPKVV